MRTAKSLIRLGGCPGWSESSLGTQIVLLFLSRGGSYRLYNRMQTNISFVTMCNSVVGEDVQCTNKQREGVFIYFFFFLTGLNFIEMFKCYTIHNTMYYLTMSNFMYEGIYGQHRTPVGRRWGEGMLLSVSWIPASGFRKVVSPHMFVWNIS